MNKKLSFIFSFFASYVLFRLFTINVSASALPVPDSSSLQLIYDANVDYSEVMGTQYGFIPETSIIPAMIEMIGSDPYTIIASDCTVRKLSKYEIKDLVQRGFNEFYDKNGNSVALNTVYFVDYSNGRFKGQFYMDSNGAICSYASGLALSTCLTSAGWVDLDFALQGIKSRLEQNNYNFVRNGADLSNNCYYLMFGTTRGGSPSDVYIMFISNQYNPYRVVPVASSNGEYINQWFANDLSVFSYSHPWGVSADVYQIEEGNFSKSGINYRYRVTFARGYNYQNVSENGSYGDFISGIGGLCRKYGLSYNSTLYIESDPYSQIEEIPDIDIEPDIPIPYPSYAPIPDKIRDELPVPNPDNDPEERPSGENMPVVRPIPPNIIVDPDPDPFPDKNPDPLPEPNQPIDPNDIGLDLPIISNLQYRFPFSIPFDLYKAFSSFEADPVTPEIVGTIEFGDFYSWDVDLDLHAFDDIAALFRKLVLISFIIWLAYFSYDHFFGK